MTFSNPPQKDPIKEFVSNIVLKKCNLKRQEAFAQNNQMLYKQLGNKVNCCKLC